MDIDLVADFYRKNWDMVRKTMKLKIEAPEDSSVLTKERFLAFMQASSDIIFLMSPDWMTMTKLYGKGIIADTEEPDMKWQGKYIPPSNWLFFNSMINDCIREKKALHLEHRVLRSNGSTGWADTKVVPLLNAKGGIKEWIGASIDITARKQIEEALQKSEAALRGKDREKNKYISMLSHEFRNPLAVIAATISLLQMSDNKDETAKLTDTLKRQSDQLCKLVDNLLDLTHINEDLLLLKKDDILLNDLAVNTASDLRKKFDVKGIHFIMDIDNKPLLLHADPVRITQIIGNLLHNAIKFTPKDGTVLLSLKQEEDEAVLRIKDNGMGIRRDLLPTLFTPFTQADNSLDRQNNDGLGLGLSIVKRIVTMHGGTVAAESEGLHKGSLFTIRLPLIIRDDAPADNSTAEPAPKTFNILVIEDNKDLAEIFCSFLNKLGHKVWGAHEGRSGVKIAREIRPDIIFCDIGLPGMNGYEVASTIKADVSLKKTLLVSFSGYTDEASLQRARESGFARHIAKPVRMDVLRQFLDECI